MRDEISHTIPKDGGRLAMGFIEIRIIHSFRHRRGPQREKSRQYAWERGIGIEPSWTEAETHRNGSDRLEEERREKRRGHLFGEELPLDVAGSKEGGFWVESPANGAPVREPRPFACWTLHSHRHSLKRSSTSRRPEDSHRWVSCGLRIEKWRTGLNRTKPETRFWINRLLYY